MLEPVEGFNFTGVGIVQNYDSYIFYPVGLATAPVCFVSLVKCTLNYKTFGIIMN